MKAEIMALWISGAAFLVSCAAAFYSGRQASAARRQADAAHGNIEPTFHFAVHEDDGRPPWGFTLYVNNFNRRALLIHRVRIKHAPDMVVYESDDVDALASIVKAIMEKGEAPFEFNETLPGIAPGSTSTQTERQFGINIKTNARRNRRLVDLAVEIDWRFATADGKPETSRLDFQVAVGDES